MYSWFTLTNFRNYSEYYFSGEQWTGYIFVSENQFLGCCIRSCQRRQKLEKCGLRSPPEKRRTAPPALSERPQIFWEEQARFGRSPTPKPVKTKSKFGWFFGFQKILPGTRDGPVTAESPCIYITVTVYYLVCSYSTIQRITANPWPERSWEIPQ